MSKRFVNINVSDNILIGDYVNKKISITDENNKSLQFQIPRMYMPFGVTGFVPPHGPVKWNVDMSMKGCSEEDSYVRKFYDFVRSIEDRVIDNVWENRQSIFGRDLSRDHIKGMFNSNIKESTAGYDPRMRFKADTNTDGSFKFKVYDRDSQERTESATDGLFAKMSGVAIVELNSVYFMNHRFGMVWRITQLQVIEPQRVRGLQIDMTNI